MELKEKLQLAHQHILAASKILIVSHTSPDADALASLGAMIEIFKNLDIKYQAFADKKPSRAYDFIPNEELISDQAPADLKIFDLIIVLDCGSMSRTALEMRLSSLLAAHQAGRLLKRPYIIEFDHHERQDQYADLEIRLPDKASTTEIIYCFLKANDLEINKNLANCILIGLMTDTGHFLHANSSRAALAVSSEMLLRGASLPKILNKTIHNKSLAALKVWGRALENMNFNPESGLAFSALSSAEISSLLSLEERELNIDLFGDIVSFLSCLSGVRVALLLREEGGRVKGSLRTNFDGIDVAKIAQGFGGGGHKKAAGFSVPGNLEKTAHGWKIA